MRPDDRKYLMSHEWAKNEDGTATIGISDFAVAHLSDLVFLDLPAVGTTYSTMPPDNHCRAWPMKLKTPWAACAGPRNCLTGNCQMRA